MSRNGFFNGKIACRFDRKILIADAFLSSDIVNTTLNDKTACTFSLYGKI